MKKKAMMMSGLGLGLLGLGGAASADEVTPTQNYTVVAGDTVSKIAVKFNTTIEKIDELNNLKDIDVISVGQILKVPTLKTNTNTNYVPVASTIQTQKPVQNTYTATQNTSQKVAQKQTQAPAPVKQSVQQPVVKQQTKSTPVVQSSNGGSETEAKEWIAQRESGGSYSANNNNKYIGRYQLSASYLNGDYSPANQERVADRYVKQRYSTWQNAKAHWIANGWY